MGDALLYSDIGGFGFNIIMVIDFLYINLLYAWSLGLMFIDFKLIFNTKTPGGFKYHGDFIRFCRIFDAIL